MKRMMADGQPSTQEEAKSKWEWSKVFIAIVATVFGIYSIWSGIEYFALCKMAIAAGTEMPDCSLPVSCVTSVMSSVWSYCAYQGVLKTSLNKNNLTIDENGVVKKIIDFAEENLDNIKK